MPDERRLYLMELKILFYGWEVCIMFLTQNKCLSFFCSQTVIFDIYQPLAKNKKGECFEGARDKNLTYAVENIFLPKVDTYFSKNVFGNFSFSNYDP